MGKIAILRELFQALAARKKLVLAPLIVVLILMALFILVAEIPVLTPFIYALF